MISIFKVPSQSLPFINNFFNINRMAPSVDISGRMQRGVSGGEIVQKLLSKTLKRMQIELWKQNTKSERKKSTDSVRRDAHNYKLHRELDSNGKDL